MPVIGGKWYPVKTFPIGVSTVDVNPFQRGTLLTGFSFIETTGAAVAEVDILDGNNAAGALAAPVSLLAGQSTRDTFGAHGLYFQSGPYLRLVAGSIRGALWYIDITEAALSAPPPSEV